MKIKIIPLAGKKIKVRKISMSMITKTVKSPDQTVEGYGGRLVKQKVFEINNKKKLLRVVYEKEANDAIVVTAYLTSQIKKYFKNNKRDWR